MEFVAIGQECHGHEQVVEVAPVRVGVDVQDDEVEGGPLLFGAQDSFGHFAQVAAAAGVEFNGHHRDPGR